MPGLDRTGPEGQGSQTGRKLGKCNPENQDNPQWNEGRGPGGRGLGRGLRRGPGGRGTGRGGPGRGPGRRFRGGNNQ